MTDCSPMIETATPPERIGTEWMLIHPDGFGRVDVPRFETGDDRYAWLNRPTFVARGRVTKDGLEYEVCRVD